jgi:hypothetical protein
VGFFRLRLPRAISRHFDKTYHSTQQLRYRVDERLIPKTGFTEYWITDRQTGKRVGRIRTNEGERVRKECVRLNREDAGREVRRGDNPALLKYDRSICVMCQQGCCHKQRTDCACRKPGCGVKGELRGRY